MTITNQDIRDEALDMLERKLTAYSTGKPLLAEVSDIVCESDKCLTLIYNLLVANPKQLESIQQGIQEEFIKILDLTEEAREKLFKQRQDDLFDYNHSRRSNID